MKDSNAKACWGFVCIKPMSELGERESVRRFGFSQWVWGRPQSGSASSGEDTSSLATPPAPCPGRTRNLWSRSDLLLTHSPLLGRRGAVGIGVGFPRQMDLETTKSPTGATLWLWGKAISPRKRRTPPGKAVGVSPCSPLSSSETKTGWTSELK